MRINFIETARLGFSLWREDDIDLAMALWGDPLVSKYIGKGGVFTERQISERLKSEIHNQVRYGVQYWPVHTKDTGEFIGCCGLRPYDVDKAMYELGFHLMSACWGKGYGTEAARAVVDYAYDPLGASGLFSGHHPNNLASAKVLGKLGFAYSHDELYAPTGLCHPSYFHSQRA